MLTTLCFEQGIELERLAEVPLEALKASLSLMGKEVDDEELRGAVAMFAK